jgi:hypothetical protein
MTIKEQCCDDRFEIINETKQYIINATNIETSPEEMNVLDSICFRLWQLGLTKRNKDKLKELTQNPTLSECIKEWEDKGYECLKGSHIISLFHKEKDIEIAIYLEDKSYCKAEKNGTDYEWITFEEHQLLTKTLKALEVEE